LERPLVLVVTLLRAVGTTGVQTQLGHQLRFSRRHRPDIDIELVTPFDVGPVRVPLFGIRYLLLPFSASAALLWYYRGHAIAARIALRRRLRRALADRRTTTIHIHAHDPWTARIALELRDGLSTYQRERVGVVMTVHYMHSQADEWISKGVIDPGDPACRILHQVERDTLPRLDRISYVSHMMRTHVEGSIPATANIPSAVTSNGVELRAPSRAVPTRDLIAIGTLEQRKNQQYLLHVLAECHRLGHPYTLTIVGTGPDRAALEERATSLGVADSVRFTGFEPGASRLIADHRALVHASFAESFGNVFLESFAAGRPVFAVPGGAVSEVFVDGDAGRHWDPDDPIGGARMLVAALEHPDRYADMSRRARARGEHFSWENQYGHLTRFVLGEPIDARPQLATSQVGTVA
jgi:glycosyltransferase involved in cell wall biosynthesis